ncbi:SDR family NAD(P)-dependent oxidoreductase [Saccharopolyspora shandongensis]|uniref:SDR family NAD(P)-dependent oxidoreductase n=1 Tax=Saccharopolyspora shandongensis TaxID=418495 RepID=UPI000B858BD0|nr:SDR family NAD(P)-dependent oxidoreductase [Saccharopolyspora shandongensis]
MTEQLVDLRDKVVFITGAAQGQGAVHARTLARLGADVVLADLDQGAVAAVAAELDVKTLALELDVRSKSAWAEAMRRARAEFGRVDVLVNNAGFYGLAPLAALEEDHLARALDVNLVGPILGMQAVLPLMRDRGGSIINVASTAGLTGFAGGIGYGASKWGLRGASKSAAKELGEFGIRVNCICPGAIDTAMISEETRAGGGAVANQPIPRAGAPAEVSALVAFLAGDASSYCTGQDFVIDGGQTI